MSEVNCHEYTLSGFKGSSLHCRCWYKDKATAKATVFLSHGYAEHLGKNYTDLAEYLAQRDIYVFGHDHVGHGKSSGTRVLINSVQDDFVENVMIHCRKVKEEMSTDIPMFIIGHSMGGLIALLAICQAPEGFFKGAVLMGPALVADPDVATPLNVFMAKVANYVMPGFQVSTLEEEKVTR